MSDGASLPVTAVCAAFGLGRPLGPPVPVAGGLSHRLWRLATTRGEFAVKELNRDFDDPNYLRWYERAFRVELAALEGRVPLPLPVPALGSGACIAELPGTGARPVNVRVHHWAEGETLASALAVTDGLAAAAGGLLARVHGLRLPPIGVMPAARFMVFGAAHWRTLCERTAAARLPWADRLRVLLPEIDALEAAVSAGQDAPDRVQMTHRDMDLKNVLITPAGGLLLLDWDQAGPDVICGETVSAMLDWAGAWEREPLPTLMHAFLRGYRACGGGIEQPAPADLARFQAIFLAWTEYNVRRCLGERLQGEGSREIAAREVALALVNLPRFAGAEVRWLALLG